MTSSFKRHLLRLTALAVCTVPPIVATVTFFPVWKNKGGGALLSGFTVLLLLVCAYPLFKALKRALRSPSVFTVWLLLFLLFSLIRRIADEMTVISFVGLTSNVIGACLFKLSYRGVKNEKPS